MRIVLLDDYQGVALELADWSRIRGSHEVVAFRDHIADEDELVRRLGAVDILCIMRERTPVMRSLLEKLPSLKLIVTTGHAHASLDHKAAIERGIAVCTTASSRFAISGARTRARPGFKMRTTVSAKRRLRSSLSTGP